MPPPTGVVRALDADEEFLERLDRVIGQPVVELGERRLTREHLHPRDLPRSAVRFLHRGIEHAHARGPDVRPGAVAADERDDGISGDFEFAAGDGDFFAGRDGAGGVGHGRVRNERRIKTDRPGEV